MAEIVTNDKNIGTVIETADVRVKCSFWGLEGLLRK